MPPIPPGYEMGPLTLAGKIAIAVIVATILLPVLYFVFAPMFSTFDPTTLGQGMYP